ncbi:MAG: LysR family transcriptional regulator [Bacteroidales bacterium]|nr:LysR family transcriptional regulator [Bacteroidales bacterium]
MELRQLKYFVEVGRLKSFSLASKSLYITQSTISQQIQKLEEELGVKLLTRDTRHVELSDYGEQFLPYAAKILEEAEACTDRIRDVKDLHTGTLSVGSTYSFGPLLIQSVLDFYRQYPHVRLRLISASWAELQQKLLDRELDIVLAYKSSVSDDRIVSKLLFENRLCLIGRKDELKDCKSPVPVVSLCQYPLALPFKGLQARDMLDSVLFANDVDLDIRLENNSIHAILDLVRSSPLLTILSGEAVQNIRELEAIPIDHPESRMQGCYHFMKGVYQKKSTQTFIDILVENSRFRAPGLLL